MLQIKKQKANYSIVTAHFTWKGGPTWDDMRPADLVLGQADFDGGDPGTTQDTLNLPYAMAVDPITGAVFVADTYNNRVLRYASATDLLEFAINGTKAHYRVEGQVTLCDIIPEGYCTDDDALLILKCEAGQPCTPVTVPGDPLNLMMGAALEYRVEVLPVEGEETTQTVQVIADDVDQHLGAASLKLKYGPADLTVTKCVTDPLAVLAAVSATPRLQPAQCG